MNLLLETPDSPSFEFPRPIRILVAAVAMLAMAGCGKAPEGGTGGPAAMFGGPVPVNAITVQPEDVPYPLDYTGQTRGAREVEVRARVTGLLLKRHYQEGARVRAGQPLFQIDPAPFEAALARAEADLAAASARQAQAAREVARLKPLIDAGMIIRKAYDDAVSAEAITAADVLAQKARVREARLNLEWTRLEAPIPGVAGRALKSEGSLVSGPDVLLTTVTQVDPIQVLFGIPDNDRLRLRQQAEAKRVSLPERGRYKVTLTLADGSEYAHAGLLDFADVRVSPETGTSEARAEIQNPDGLLQPGQFVRVRLAGASRLGAFRIPQRAILEGPQGKFVYVVGKESKAEIRPVEAGEWIGGNAIVTGGLTAGEQVIVDGVLKLGPGAPVQVGAPAAPAQPGSPPAGAPKAGG